MKLLQRLNYILLPVMVAVFIVAGAVAYYFFSHHAKHELIERWENKLAFVQQEGSLERRSMRASLAEILNSAQVIQFLNSQVSSYQAFSLESSVFKLLKIARENNPEIDSIQLLNSQGDVVISADGGDPFSEVKVVRIPSNIVGESLRKLTNGEHFSRQEIVYQNSPLKIRYAVIQPFSPGLLLNDRFSMEDSGRYIAIMDGELTSMTSLYVQVKKAFGSDAVIRLIPNIEISDQGISDAVYTTVENDNSINFTLTDSLYELQLVIQNSVMANLLINMLWFTIGLTSILSIISFFCLRILIQRQIVGPINKLVNTIESTQHSETIPLVRLESNDEVAKLNNAYLMLIKRLQHMASYDHLTGLGNRRNFLQWLSRLIPRAEGKQYKLALLYIDLDNFKQVNDQHGHAVGDSLLRKFSEELRLLVRPTDAVSSLLDVGDDALARLAGDEFAVLLHDISGPQIAEQVANRIHNMFKNGFVVDKQRYNVHASVGIAMYPDDGTDADTLLVHADAAMYQAKSSGKNRHDFFSIKIAADIELRKHIEEELVAALESEDFKLVYMPVFNASSLQIEGAEVLLRCSSLAKKNIGPDQFIPIAESTGLIQKIDLWVFEESLKALLLLQNNHGYKGFLAINFSAIELQHEQFPDDIESLITHYKVDPKFIEIEITETSLIDIDDRSCAILQRLKNIGISLSLDDFGTGYTAFNQLANYPVDCLKIDRSFVNDLATVTNEEQPMFDIFFALARLYKLQVVAEGVETADQLTYLQSKGCERVQGFYLSKPIDIDEFYSMLIKDSVDQ